MFLHLLTIVAIIVSLHTKPIVVRNISDCSITEDGILYYQGKHSLTKFEHECLPWDDLQTVFPGLINEPSFFNDASVKAAKNYCRNPDMNINGPWCYVQNEDTVSIEECDVCQSLAPGPTLPTDIESIDEVTSVSENNGFFQNLRDGLRRFGGYIRQKFVEIFERIKKKVRQFWIKNF